jgi:peptidoglycan/LPS O-acetylase OafA/YrhL
MRRSRSCRCSACTAVALPVTYLTVYLGTLDPARPVILQTGDYSYSIYLYGFPVQQLVAQLGPWTHHWAVNLLLSLPLTAVIAALSWHGIEQHVLKLRRHLPAVERALSTSVFARLSRFKAPVIGDRVA